MSSFYRTVQTSSYLSATDPDLSRFKRSGGRLILWHGWSDQHISPQATLEYWDAMHRTMGNVDGFGRLYLFPGMAHCAGGVGPNTFDVLGEGLYTHGYQTTCRVVNGKLVCVPTIGR